MFDRHKNKSIVTMAAALIATMGLGGAAIASAAKSPPKAPTPASASAAETPGQETTSGRDTDNVQSGDQTTPDTKSASAEQEASSEKVADDGPGGHADEPGNPNADHQFEGVE